MFNKSKLDYSTFFKVLAISSMVAVAAGCSPKLDAQSSSANSDKQNLKVGERSTEIETGDVPSKTNIVYMVLDDSGFSDLGSFGSEIKTPNLDKLAKNGLRYNNFNVTPLCSPTRASLLTGRNHHTVGMGSVANFDYGPEFPNKRGSIRPEAGTIAEVLSENGYNTYALGKWHLSPTSQVTPAGPYNNWPLGKGFNRFYGFLEDSADQYRPELTEDNHSIPVPSKEGYHFSKDIVDKSIQYAVDNISVAPDNPFFMYMAFGAQHQPHQVPEKYIDMYNGVYDEGWDVIRQKRFDKQKALGIIPKDTKLATTNPGVDKWDDLSEENKKAFIRMKQTYAGFLTHTDEQVGRFMDFLEEKGELDNTMIVFLSDNGASAIGGKLGSVNQSMAYNTIPENIDDILDNYEEMGGEKAGTDYPAGWGQVSNTPFKFYKNSTYAGGTHTPLIISWPAGIKDKGAIRSQYVHVSDITATVYDMLGIEVPETIKGVEQMPLSGTSFVKSFTDSNAESAKKTQYFEVSGHRAIYSEGWRALTMHVKGEPFENDKWELYHVDKDFSEMHDLAKEEPKKLEEMKKLWMKEAEENGVLPLSDLFLEAFANVADDSPRARSSFIYYPEMSHLSDSASPPIINRSYTIDVPIKHKGHDEGVLLALGNHKSGYTLYIKNNQLVYEYNAGFKRYKIVSDKKLDEGELVIQFAFNKTDDYAGIGSLYVNDEKYAELKMEKTLPYKTAFEGMDIGKDLLYPVSPEYADQGEFNYSGYIEKVVFKLKNDLLTAGK
ncbi:arylsulfatase [Sporosarcina sp. P13]|uniref:arylsulfatase n=1 Tax=Sporosarcina sp. P13 TaxID=2048263 RepID=UPI001E3BD63D|nr:arylsulfatase [Sporosarcina sp. P13]